MPNRTVQDVHGPLSDEAKSAMIDILRARLYTAYKQWDREVQSGFVAGNPRIGHLETKMPAIASKLRDLEEDCPPVPGESDYAQPKVDGPLI